MGTSSDPSSNDPKQKIVMGYPSMDRYNHPAQDMYPPPPQGTPPMYPILAPPQGPHTYLVSYQPQGYAPQPSFHANQGVYATPSSLSYNQGGYASSSFHQYGNYPSNTAQNPYSPSSMNEYYYQQYYTPPVVHETNETTSFGRLMLILMIILFASMCMMSIVMWFLFGTYIPEFEVISLKVSNFTATNTIVTGIWDANVAVKNLNEKIKIDFDHIRSSIFYREVMMGMSSLPPFQVQERQQTQFNFSMAVEPHLNNDKLQSLVLPTLVEDRANGVVHFSLRLSMNANFTSPHLVYRQQSLRVLCDNLQITFSPTGEGTLTNDGLETTCLILLRESLD